MTAQTNAVLKSTGRIAGVTAKHVEALGKAIEHKSAFDDEAVRAGENVLLSFTNIRNGATEQTKIFDRTTQAVADYAARTGVDVPIAARLLGKALNDPIKGLTRLTRVGIDFTDAEKKQIKQLVNAGEVQKAQAVILQHLETRYKGAAAAAGNTLSGQVSKLKNSLLDMGGVVVGLVTPGLQKWLDHINKWLQKGENQQKVIDDISKAGRTLKSVVEAIVNAGQTLWPVIDKIAKAFGGWKNVMIALIGLKAASWATGLIGPIGGIGGAARASERNVRGLRGALLSLNGLRVVATIAIAQELFSMFQGSSPPNTPGSGHTGVFDALHDINKHTGKRGALGTAEHKIATAPGAIANFTRGIFGRNKRDPGTDPQIHSVIKKPGGTFVQRSRRRGNAFFNLAAAVVQQGIVALPGGGDLSVNLMLDGEKLGTAVLKRNQRRGQGSSASRRGPYAGINLGLG